MFCTLKYSKNEKSSSTISLILEVIEVRITTTSSSDLFFFHAVSESSTVKSNHYYSSVTLSLAFTRDI